MEVYVLDSLLRRDTVVDRFLSLIWTERFTTFGDFELVVHSTTGNRQLFTTDTWLAMNESWVPMIIDTCEDTTDADGKATLTVKGYDLKGLLAKRPAMAALSDTTTNPKYTIVDTPGAIMRQVFHDICVTGVLDVNDIIPFIVEDSIMPDSTIAEPLDPVTMETDPTTVYNILNQVGDAWSLGFRILRNQDAGQLYFDVYAGSDRTTQQTVLPAVIFSPSMDNLQNTTELTSNADLRNVAYVISPAGFEVVYAENVPPDVAGFDRRVMLVNASDVTVTDPPTDPAVISATLIQRGTDALAQQRSFKAFDGEIGQNSSFKYGVDYYLGDLVEMRNVDGVTNLMRVTEQIFVSDEQGERTYPTLAINIFIDTGTWLSWNANEVWSDVDDSPYWADA